MWPESLAQWAQLGDAFQGLATGLAVLIGALWALVRFFSLKEVAKARVALEREILELRERQPIVDLTIRIEQVAQGSEFFVVATVVAKNSGTKVARFAYEGAPPLGVFAVAFEAAGTPVFREALREHVRLAANPSEYAKTTIVRSGQTQEIPFLLKLPGPGWYLLAFRAVQSAEDRELLRSAGVPDHRIVSWTAKQYVRIDRTA